MLPLVLMALLMGQTSDQAPAAATAPVARVADTATAQPVAAPRERLICRSRDGVESRLQSRRDRVCRTRAQWDAVEAAHAIEARGLTQNSGSVQYTPPGG